MPFTQYHILQNVNCYRKKQIIIILIIFKKFIYFTYFYFSINFTKPPNFVINYLLIEIINFVLFIL